MRNSKGLLLLILAGLVLAASLWAILITRNRQQQESSIHKVIDVRTGAEKARQAALERIEETNRLINASSTLKEEFEAKKEVMSGRLIETNQLINASSTLKEEFDERKEVMVNRLIETNQLINASSTLREEFEGRK